MKRTKMKDNAAYCVAFNWRIRNRLKRITAYALFHGILSFNALENRRPFTSNGSRVFRNPRVVDTKL